jgi:hypothetical protein
MSNPFNLVNVLWRKKWNQPAAIRAVLVLSRYLEAKYNIAQNVTCVCALLVITMQDIDVIRKKTRTNTETMYGAMIQIWVQGDD